MCAQLLDWTLGMGMTRCVMIMMDKKSFLLIAIYDGMQMKVCGAPVVSNESFQLPVLFIESRRDSSHIRGALNLLINNSHKVPIVSPQVSVYSLSQWKRTKNTYSIRHRLFMNTYYKMKNMCMRLKWSMNMVQCIAEILVLIKNRVMYTIPITHMIVLGRFTNLVKHVGRILKEKIA